MRSSKPDHCDRYISKFAFHVPYYLHNEPLDDITNSFVAFICGVFAAVVQPSNRNKKRTEGVSKF
jgi:hypothetical protein